MTPGRPGSVLGVTGGVGGVAGVVSAAVLPLPLPLPVAPGGAVAPLLSGVCCGVLLQPASRPPINVAVNNRRVTGDSALMILPFLVG